MPNKDFFTDTDSKHLIIDKPQEKSSVSDPYSSNSDPAKNLNPDFSYFFTQSEKKIKLCYYYKFLSSKEVN